MKAGGGRSLRPLALGIAGPGECDDALALIAEEVGAATASAGAVLVCGGLGGVMAAACRGARDAGGTTVGLLPGERASDANLWVSIAIPTALGELRNGLVVRASDVLVAVGGAYGTLSEIALALKLGRPVVGLGTWQLVRPDGVSDDGIHVVERASDAVALAVRLGSARR